MIQYKLLHLFSISSKKQQTLFLMLLLMGKILILHSMTQQSKQQLQKKKNDEKLWCSNTLPHVESFLNFHKKNYTIKVWTLVFWMAFSINYHLQRILYECWWIPGLYCYQMGEHLKTFLLFVMLAVKYLTWIML